VRVFAAAAAALIILLAGFLLGKHQASVTVVTAVAAVGYRQATVTAGGWSYGIEGGVQFWIDSHSGVHEGGWPSCLNLWERPKVTIGAVPASLPGGTSWRQVMWVGCRG
jgi:hypothetical protein